MEGFFRVAVTEDAESTAATQRFSQILNERSSNERSCSVFGELPKTSTGKIQKFVLRQKAKSAQAIE